jgi:hypothetical protein
MRWCTWVDRTTSPQAVALYDRVIEIKTAALGADHIETANTLHGKATVLVLMGGSANLAAAVALYDRAIEVKTAALGADHPETALVRRHKASALVRREPLRVPLPRADRGLFLGC